MPGRSFELAPPEFHSRQSFHPWLVVGVTCIGAFIGQVDASIVQLGVSAASSMVAWRLEQRGGRDSLDVLFGGRALLDAMESSLVVLIVFALTAGLISWLPPPAGR
jgi:hypothetical protein